MEFEREFPNDAACLDWLVAKLYPNGIHCPTCKAVTRHHREASRPSYACQNCGHHEHPTKGTIFERSATSLKLWFYAIYLMSATRCGISAKQLERELGVTYKTAWRMFGQIRKMLAEDVSGLGGSGPVEIDESFFGGKNKNRHRDKRTTGRGPYSSIPKQIVFGAIERGGRVYASVVPDTTAYTLWPHITKRVLPSSMVFTDEAPVYEGLGDTGHYQHGRCHHAAEVWVGSGGASTNAMEGYWSLVKRGISGVYHAVGSAYLQSYLDEYSFRHNHRTDERGMFHAMVDQITKPSSWTPCSSLQ